jgi:hypothetical protein
MLKQEAADRVVVILQAPTATAAREVGVHVETWKDELRTGMVDVVVAVQPVR